MWTKLRPGVHAFLEAAHARFDLHVYTMGDKSYAAEMARLLDPTGRLFQGRVISSVCCPPTPASIILPPPAGRMPVPTVASR